MSKVDLIGLLNWKIYVLIILESTGRETINLNLVSPGDVVAGRLGIACDAEENPHTLAANRIRDLMILDISVAKS